MVGVCFKWVEMCLCFCTVKPVKLFEDSWMFLQIFITGHLKQSNEEHLEISEFLQKKTSF